MKPEFVTEDDVKDYNGFFQHHIDQIVNRKPKGPLFHYTAGTTLISILQSRTLWSTHVSCLNDAKEWIFAVEALREVLAVYRSRSTNQRAWPCLDLIEEVTRDASHATVPPFVTCFTAKWDDLSQWRGYGGEAGYSLEFDFHDLATAAVDNSDWLVPVLYGSEATVLLEDALRWAESFYVRGLDQKRAPTDKQWTEDFTRFWLWNLSFLAPMIKSEVFADEAEWRVIHYLRDDDIPTMKFLQRRGMMTKHVPLSLCPKGGEGTPLFPLRRITVGPSNNMEVSRVSVGDLLRSTGYRPAIEIDVSKAPYRPYL